MIVVATEDFELYHEAVAELRERGATFETTIPGDPLPEDTRVLITTEADLETTPALAGALEDRENSKRAGEGENGGDGKNGGEDTIEIVTATAGIRETIDRALTAARKESGRTVVGVDPGEQPGIAVLSGESVVAAFQVPLAEAAAVIDEEIEDAVDPVVRVGDGARLAGSALINELDIPVELVDETATTPYLGTGARGAGDVLAAVNIARRSGDVLGERTIEPTTGEIDAIKARSRERSDENREIDEELARRVATGELSIQEALDEHRER